MHSAVRRPSGLAGRPRGSLAVDPTYYQQKGKLWRNQKINWNYLFGFALLCSAIGKQNLPREPSKIPITTSTFNGMELSIILIARLPDCLFTCVISHLLILGLVMSTLLCFGGPHLKTVLISLRKDHLVPRPGE